MIVALVIVIVLAVALAAFIVWSKPQEYKAENWEDIDLTIGEDVVTANKRYLSRYSGRKRYVKAPAR